MLTVHRNLNFSQKKQIHEKFLQMVTSDFQPLSILQDALKNIESFYFGRRYREFYTKLNAGSSI